MPDKYAFMEQELASLADEGRLINIRTMESPAGAWMIVDGRKVLNFCTNNYLGLANHPQIKAAARQAIEQWGVGPAAVRTIAGTQALHLECERRLAAFKSVEAALLVQSGFCANQAAIPPLVGRDRETGEQDVLFSDRLNHASIIDGARLSGCKIVVYEHCDPADLEAKVLEHLPDYRRGMVVTDGVFSMDGDVAPLDEIYAVAERHGLLTMVDDAHGEGVLGRGKGIVSHFGLEGQFDVEIGTMSKAFGVMGGVIAGRQVVIDYIRQKARPNLFSSALTPADTAACLAAVGYVDEHPELVDRLWENAGYLKAGLAGLGLDTGRTQTPIVPVMLGDVKLAKAFSARLFENGVFAMALGFPTVPQGQARIRVMNTAAHSREDLDYGLAAFEKTARQLGVLQQSAGDNA
jgi:glycine C-acetyltransferase